MSGQDKTVLTEFQITLILYTYESLGVGVIINNETMKHKIFNETQNFNSHFFIIIILNI